MISKSGQGKSNMDDLANELGRYLGSARVWKQGIYVIVRYSDFGAEVSLKKRDAAQYLHWLRAGNKGEHWEAGL